MKKEEKVNTLEHLARICKDSELGLRRALTELQNEPYKDMLLAAAQRRADASLKIWKELEELGTTSTNDGTMTGRLHRSLMNIRYELNLHDEDVVLDECLRGEEFALNEFEKMIENHSLKADPVVEGLFINIIELRNQLREIIASQRNTAESDSSMLHLKL